jgi:chitodextrinase
VAHGDDFARGRQSAEPPGLELDDGTVVQLLYAQGRAPQVPAGARVSVRGVRSGGRVAVADGSTTVTSDVANAAPTGTTKRVAIVLFTFSNATTQPYTTDQARAVAFTSTGSVATYFAQSSWGGVAMTGDVFGWYAIPDTNTSCSYSAWASSANAAAAAAGVDLSGYDHVVYGFPATSACGWSGLGYLPGRTSWLNGPGGMSLRTMAHELGHNFGTHHASTLACTEGGVRVTLTASGSGCTSSEYGDPFTVMGASTRKPTAFSLANFGWLPGTSTATATVTGEYALTSVYGAYGAVQQLRIQRTTSTYLALELRQPASLFDTFALADPAVTGVSVRITGELTTRTQSQLLDMTPSTTSFADAPLGAGRTWIDPLTGIGLTTVSVSAGSAVVHVAFGSSPGSDTTAPTTPGNLRATALDASRVSLTWSASTDAVGVTGYRVSRDGVVVATVAATGTGFTDTGLAPVTGYAYQVVAVDAAGNASAPASASATTLAPTPVDTAPPSAPTDLTASVAKRKVTLAWRASTDDIGVTAYRVYRDGRLVGTVTVATAAFPTRFVDTLPGKVRSARYTVVALDGAGNASLPSAVVTVTV